MAIHPTAIIDPRAKIDESVEIGPYSVIDSDVSIGAGTRIANNVRLCRGVVLGSDCVIHSNVVIGDDPQYIGFDTSLKSGVIIGDRSVIRENVTIHRSIYEGENTILGSENYLMVGCHVAHDCELADNVVLTNEALLAGHVTVEKNVYIGGGALFHQFVRVGEGSMIGGGAAITRDVAPFIMVSGRDEVSGLNLVGLKRRGVSRESIKELKELFHSLFHRYGNIREQAAEELENRGDSLSAEGGTFLEFFRSGKRGFCGVDLKSKGDE